MIRIGVVNIDVSHPKAFSQILMEEDRARYAAVFNEGFRGEEEVNGFCESAGLDKICHSLEELVRCSDVGFIQACNWDKHISHAMPFLRAGKPVFIDKPMVGNIRDCQTLLELEKNGAVILGSSSVRYCQEIRQFLEQPEQQRGKLLHAVATVGMDEFNYAIHAVEGLCAVAESRPKTVRYLGQTRQDDQSCASYYITFESGASATCHCVQDRFLQFHMTLLTTKQDVCMTLDNSRLYAPMLREICNRLEGKENRMAPLETLLWPIRVLLAGKLSQQRDGAEISAWDPDLDTVCFDGFAFEKKYAAAAKPIYV